MTTISELFNQRRSRLSRKDVDSDLDLSPVDRVSHHQRNKNYRRHHHNSRRGLHGLDGCDTVRRSPQLRHPIHRPSVSEHDSIRLDEGSGNNASGNIANLESMSTMSSRLRFNDRLPGAVILARERLLQ